jgi:hypothetical protein
VHIKDSRLAPAPDLLQEEFRASQNVDVSEKASRGREAYDFCRLWYVPSVDVILICNSPGVFSVAILVVRLHQCCSLPATS